MQGIVRKWGNSAAVRVPASVLEETAIGLDQTVEVRAEQGRIVIEKVVTEAADLAALVAGITDDNRHDEMLAGGAVGREAWS